jgi:hypothetical protein
MIIEVSDEFSEFNSDQWLPYAGAIEHLITAHANGWHIFTPSRRAANSILSSCNLSDRQTAIFRSSVLGRLAILVGQAKSADYTMLAIPDGSLTAQFRPNQIVVPLSRFSEMEACQPTRLLTEDSAFDGLYYARIANIVARDLGYGVRLKLELMHGGGAGLAARYGELLRDSRPAICVVDSDRRYPDAPLGNTARGINALGWSNPLGTVRAAMLPVREAENTLPISFLLDVYKANPVVRAQIKRYTDYLSKVESGTFAVNVLLHLDLKEGDTVGRIANVPMPHKNHFVEACRDISVTNIPVDNFDDPDSQGRAYHGIAENVLRTTLEFMKLNPRLDRDFGVKIKKAPFWNEFEGIIRLILSFGASDVAVSGR